MYTWNKAVLTRKGRSLLTKLTKGHTLALVRAVSGSGYVEEDSLKYQSSLTDERQELLFSIHSYPEEGTCVVPVRLLNAGLSVGYTASQIGIYAMDPDEGEILYLIVQADTDQGTDVPSESEMPGYSAEWRFHLEYGQADGVSVTVDPSNTVNEDDVRNIISEVVTKENLGIDKVDNTPDSQKNVSYASRSGTADKTKNSLVFRLKGGSTEGTDMFTYNGSTGKSVNVTPEKIQALPGVEDDENSSGCYFRTVNGEKEWINPPMMIGVEYRTTERQSGYPVYTQLVYGTFPQPGGCTEVVYEEDGTVFPVRCSGYIEDSASKTFPVYDARSTEVLAVVSAIGNKIICATTTEAGTISSYGGFYAQVWYTKEAQTE